MTNITMENPPIFKNGKPSISMGHGYTMANWVSKGAPVAHWRKGPRQSHAWPDGDSTSFKVPTF